MTAQVTRYANGNVLYTDFASDPSVSIDLARKTTDAQGTTYSFTFREIDDYCSNRCNGEIKITHDGRLQCFRCHDMFGYCFWVEPSLMFRLITNTSLTSALKTPDYKHVRSC